MSVLIIGANGQVGWELARQAPAAGIAALALDRAALDITDPAAVEKILRRYAPRLVINAAAYTAVDRAEEDAPRAFAVNRDGPANLAAAARAAGLPLLHISTDYVFDGSQAAPYREDAPAAPLGVYGRSKWAGEEAVRQTLACHLILRVSWVFGSHGQNFVKTILRFGRERQELRVVDDQRGCPTPAADIAAVLLRLAARILTGQPVEWGTYHYCGTPATTWFAFAEHIFAAAERLLGQPSPRLCAIPSSEYPTPVTRPVNSVLDCRKIAAAFGIRPRPWAEGLTAMLEELRP